ncbi:MAG TPA: Ig-like domain-containing protein [Terracidiphilus sp.]|nr:Ig-like domain-containing protein [Terracidiphilus sp.]
MHVRRMDGRGLRLKLAAGLGFALAIFGSAISARAENVPTLTTLALNTTTQGGKTQAHATVTVADEDGHPAQGIVSIDEGSRQLAQIALNAAGQATSNLDLPGGQHTLRAVYSGDSIHQGSVSDPQAASAATTSTPDFQVTVSSLEPSNTLSPGEDGTATVTVTPVNNAALTAPMFITVSCSGLPDQSACTFTPETVEVDSTTPASCASGSAATACPPTSSLVIQTQGPGTAAQLRIPAAPGRAPSRMAWAFVLPSALGLGGVAFGARRRRWLSHLFLLAAVGVVTVLGTAGCNPQYYYYNHGQPTNPATPAGTYTIDVTAQSSNGITAITHTTTLALTVK